MNCDDGTIRPLPEILDMVPEERELYKEMSLPLTARQEKTGRVGRNDPCPCGSGKKFKACCLRQVEMLALMKK